jgi:cholesterol oxidase
MVADQVDAVVVGSGFGGSVSAYRLAVAGLTVCVLERGKRYPPGQFPRRPDEMARNFWDPSEGQHGLFDVWSFRRFEAVVASGLGGGSLIYANVLRRKDPTWFVERMGASGGYEDWPIRPEELAEPYAKVERILGANPYPYAADTPKTRFVQAAGRRHGREPVLPNLAVTFSAPGEPFGSPIPRSEDNLHHVPRSTCRLCGECNIGCNYGSKNTLDLTYLTFADDCGADLRDRCEVREFEPIEGGGFLVRYVRHSPENEGVRIDTSRLRQHVIRCRILVLAAGSLGTTFLLLRNQRWLPRLGPALGFRFSGNGDLLAWIHGATERLEPSNGPVITAMLREPDLVDGGTGRGFYVQDGGHPVFADWLFEQLTPPIARYARAAAARLAQAVTGGPHSQVGAQAAALLGGGRRSAGILPLLGMGRDVPDGRLGLHAGHLVADLGEATSQAFFRRVGAVMAELADQAGGRLFVNPPNPLKRRVTVHPLGGAPMGRDPSRGVVDSHGESFGHPGLFVADGAVMPGPVGPNPSLTIAALAERFTERMIERAGGGNG